VEQMTDWSALWRELVEIKERGPRKKRAANSQPDSWAGRAIEFRESVKRRWMRPDSSREFVLSIIDRNSTVLDIGAGTGAWTLLLAPHAKRITAVEPSHAMIEVLRENLVEEKVPNVSVIQGAWPDVTVEPHDYSLCSHAVYNSTDLAAFIRRMVACTRRMCILLLRATSPDGIRAEAARHIWGQPMDSPNFTVAYNVLLQLGIFANVQMENTGLWKPRTSTSLQEALADMHRFLSLDDPCEHDAYLRDLLQRRLTLKDGLYIWPPDVRSALVYWNVAD
jgi:SAM-dependent methyltransferase